MRAEILASNRVNRPVTSAFRAMASDRELFDELSFYTLAHPDPGFIHQLSVDAYTAQHAEAATKPIAVVFALIGLYLHLEKNFTGKQVQRAHMKMARQRKQWPRLPLPEKHAAVTVADVMAAAPGAERDARIEAWCAAVWAVWEKSRDAIVRIAKTELDVE